MTTINRPQTRVDQLKIRLGVAGVAAAGLGVAALVAYNLATKAPYTSLDKSVPAESQGVVVSVVPSADVLAELVPDVHSSASVPTTASSGESMASAVSMIIPPAEDLARLASESGQRPTFIVTSMVIPPDEDLAALAHQASSHRAPVVSSDVVPSAEDLARLATLGY